MSSDDLKADIHLESSLRQTIQQQAEIVSAQQEIATSVLSLEHVMSSLVERTRRISNADGAVVELVEGDEMVYVACSGSAATHVGLRIPIAGSLTGLCAKQNQILRCDDTEADPRVNKDACAKIGARSMILVPLQREGKSIGVLKVVSATRSAFDHGDVTTLQMMAGVMSSALVNASVIQALRDKETMLAEKNLQLERATEVKSQFLANMSHEIRTPLTVILGLAEQLVEGGLGQARTVQVGESIRRNGRHLLKLVNDILDISKIEAGKMDVEHIACSPLRLVEEVCEILEPSAREKGLQFQVNNVYPLPKAIRSDPTRIRQILFNLVSNAIKFTSSGHIGIKCEFAGSRSALVLEVKDSGIGISDEQVKQLFKPFAQADASTTRRFGGSGLGLAISHQLVRLLGGTLSVESSPDVGTAFRVELPVEPGTSELLYSFPAEVFAARPVQEAVPQLLGTVLLVEDSEDIAAIVTHLVRKTGAHIEVAVNGQEALNATDTRPFDLVLMDMQMPVLDGYTATRLLREKRYNRPILGLTANTIGNGLERCLAAGCTDALGKPFERKEFYAKLAQYLRAAPSLEESEDDESELDPRIRELRASFMERLPERLRCLTRWSERGEWERIAEEAHTLAGAGLMGFYELAVDAAELAKVIANGSTELVAERLQKLNTHVQATARSSGFPAELMQAHQAEQLVP